MGGFHMACNIFLIIATTIALPSLSFGADLIPVEGKHCYRYGDDESVTVAKTKALAFAREVAVSNFKVWVEVNTAVKDFVLEKDWIETIAVGMLQNEERQVTRKIQEICTALKAWIDPQEVDSLIAKRMKLREVKQKVSSKPSGAAFGLKVWLDKPDGQYVEGENLIIKVQSERDTYLKLDYFQADCKVVHLVPNLFRQQAHIEKGKIYEFGKDDSPEQFKIHEPFGDEVIKAIASIKPFPVSQISNEMVSNCDPYIKTLEQGNTRGISVHNTANAEVSLFTTSKEVLEHKKAVGN